MNCDRCQPTYKRIGSALLLCGVLVGLPTLFAHIGSPLPARWPSWARFVTDVRVGYAPSSAALKVALAAGWACWAFLSYEIVAETSSWVRNHASRRSSALGPFQPLLAKVVAAIVLSAPLPGRGLINTASVPMTATIELSSAALVASAVPPVPLPAGLDSLPTYVVQPHDTLWGIAERYLGNPLRWSEIASLNEGRPEGPDQFEDPNWIYPGWTLVLPADAAGLDSSVDAAVGNETPMVQEKTPTPPPRPRQVSPSTSATARSVSTADYASGGRRIPAASASRPAHEAHRLADRAKLPVGPIGYGIIGAGVIGVLDRVRRARQRRQPRGVRIKLSEGELADLERDLRVGADHTLLSWVDLGLRLLAEHAIDEERSAPRVVAVRCRPDVLELIIEYSDAPSSPPHPFRATSEPNVWVLDREWLAGMDLARRRMLSRAESLTPSLVTVGSDDVGPVLVDIELLGSLTVVGIDADMVLQGMTVELATAPWAEGADIVVAGHHGELKALERVRTAGSLASLVSEMRRRVISQDALLSSGGVARAADGRSRYGGAGWDPTVVVCLSAAVEAEPFAAERLLQLGGDGRHGVVVLAGSRQSLPSRWSARADGGSITLVGPSGPGTSSSESSEEALTDLELVPQAVPSGLLEGVDSLIDAAISDGGVPVVNATPGTMTHLGAAASAVTSAAERQEVEVRVLGPVEVLGNARPFSRAWALELVVYLVIHDEGATTDQWATALWPDRLMAPASLHSTASSARRSLGVSTTGTDHLPRAHGRLKLGPGVTSDWARFQRLAASDGPDDHVAALRLIRGRPFQGLRSADWTVLEGTVAWMETMVVDLAIRYAESCLEAKDASAAEWAARQALRISPYDERLYRVLLRSADVAGHPEGVEATMRELVQLVADEVEPYDSVHPETLELYKRLSRRAGAIHGT